MSNETTIIQSKVCPDCKGDPVSTSVIEVNGADGPERLVERLVCGRCEGSGTVKLCPLCGMELDLGGGFDAPDKEMPEFGEVVSMHCSNCRVDIDLGQITDPDDDSINIGPA